MGNDTTMCILWLLKLSVLRKEKAKQSGTPGGNEALGPLSSIEPTFPRLMTIEVPKDKRRSVQSGSQDGFYSLELSADRGVRKFGINVYIDDLQLTLGTTQIQYCYPAWHWLADPGEGEISQQLGGDKNEKTTSTST
jgi:hypothetical protein